MFGYDDSTERIVRNFRESVERGASVYDMMEAARGLPFELQMDPRLRMFFEEFEEPKPEERPR